YIRHAAAVSVLAAAAVLAAHAESPAWLERVNFYRATASLPSVEEDVDLSRGIVDHARYMLRHGVVKHDERRGDRWTTADGAAAAAASNLAGSSRIDEPDSWAVDTWMQAPFHAIGILDPALSRVGFGIEHAHTSNLQTAAGLDVIRGRRVDPSSIQYPVVWPSDGAVVPIAAHVEEYPSPLVSCPGYTAPSGLPLIVQLGRDETPHVRASAFVEGDRLLEHCVFDGGTYWNPDAAERRLGRSILASRGAIVMIPRNPLRPGASYRAAVDVNDRRIEWIFSVR
ncbi:MAG TPA: CAP domain-containing protein, partial [Vicinamibacterales bacterium]|nr:CAP domain-containing protein [Vicinamibacterales bacterium]